jgi:hypothetical protein
MPFIHWVSLRFNVDIGQDDAVLSFSGSSFAQALGKKLYSITN